MPKLYDELAVWWPLFSPVEDYEEEVDYFVKVLPEPQPGDTLLELGSGGGNNAFFLKQRYAATTLVDLSPGMLAVSQALNLECEHLQGDMRSVRLGRAFDVVFIHDAIMYMTSRDDLRRAIETAFAHTKPGGVALLVPDHVRETYQPGTDWGGEDGEGRGIRWLEWHFDPDPNDDVCSEDFVFMFREGNGPVRVDHDHHDFGLFPLDTWMELMTGAGFQPNYSIDPFNRHVFLARKP